MENTTTDQVTSNQNSTNLPIAGTEAQKTQDANVATTPSDAAIQTTLDTAKDEKLVNDNKDQLHRRVMQRQADLAKALEELGDSSANVERRTALIAALDAGRDVTNAGWENVGEMAASQLARWLETTEALIAVGSGAPLKLTSETDPTGRQAASKPTETPALQS